MSNIRKKNLPSLFELVLESASENIFEKGGILKAQNGLVLTKPAVVPVPKSRSSEIKEHNSRLDYTLPAHMKVRKDTPEEIVAKRKARIQASVEARKAPWTKDNWRERLAAETAATGDKLSLKELPIVGEYVPGILDVTGGIGSMASALGAAPLAAQRQDSFMPYVKAVGAPLVAGALGSLGTKTTAGFVNNTINPLAGTGDLIRGLATKIAPGVVNKEAVRSLRRAADIVSVPNDVTLPLYSAMRRDIAQVSSPETVSALGKLSNEELNSLHRNMFPDREHHQQWRAFENIIISDIDEAERLGRIVSGDELYRSQIATGSTPSEAKNQVARAVENTDPYGDPNYISFSNPTKGEVVKSLLPKKVARKINQITSFKNRTIDGLVEANKVNALSPRSIYYNTKKDLIGDSTEHRFFSMTPREVAKKVDDIIDDIPAGGIFSEKSLSTDSFRMLTPKLGAMKDFKVINTGRLQPLNGYGNKGQELIQKYGQEEGNKKIAELMNTYIERLEVNTGKQISRAKVIDGNVYVPQLLAKKKGGSAMQDYKRSENQIIGALAPLAGASATYTVSSIVSRAREAAAREEEYKKRLESLKEKEDGNK